MCCRMTAKTARLFIHICELHSCVYLIYPYGVANNRKSYILLSCLYYEQKQYAILLCSISYRIFALITFQLFFLHVNINNAVL